MATLSLRGRFFKRENSHHPKLGLGFPFCRFPVNLPNRGFFVLFGCGKRRVSATAAAAHFEFGVLFILFYGILCVRALCSTCMVSAPLHGRRSKCKNQFYYATASLCFPANSIVSPVQKKVFFLARYLTKTFYCPHARRPWNIICEKAHFNITLGILGGSVWV